MKKEEHKVQERRKQRNSRREGNESFKKLEAIQQGTNMIAVGYRNLLLIIVLNIINTLFVLTWVGFSIQIILLKLSFIYFNFLYMLLY